MKLFKVYFDCSCILLQCESKDDIHVVLIEYDDSFDLDDEGEIIFVVGEYSERVTINEINNETPGVLLAELH